MGDMHLTNERQCPCCGSVIDGRFCKDCGQKVIEHKQTIWHFVIHFASDIFHYDGKFIKTLKVLLTRPGFLTVEYRKGVREKYLDPAKLYLFLSAIVFVVLITFEKPESTITKISDPKIVYFIDSARAALQTDSAFRAKINNNPARHAIIKSTLNGCPIEILEVPDMMKHGERYYDSIQNTLPPEKRSTGYKRYKERKLVRAYEVYDTAPYNYAKKRHEKINLVIPKSFFISMPFFVIGLLILNYKKRKRYPSAYHAIFTLHFYSTVWVFIMLDSIIAIFLEHPETAAIYSIIAYTILSGCMVYLFVAMLRFYEDKWWLTLIKAIILTGFTILYSILVLYTLREYHILSLGAIEA